MKVKSLEFEIKESPDPENPDEKPEGNALKDDRIYKRNILTISVNDMSYNKGKFTKVFKATTLNAPTINFVKGDIVTVFYTKKENN